MVRALAADLPRKGRLLLAIAAAGLAAACVSAPKERVATAKPLDPNSPVVRDVEAASRHPGPYPRFADIPATPKDVRPSADWRKAVAAQRAVGAATDKEVVELPTTLSDTEAYAETARSRAAGHESDAPSASTREQTEAYAAAQRARATPPPAPQ